MIKYIFLLILSSSILFAQNKNLPVVVIGDSLVGRNIDGVKMREVIGNVIITQGDVKITCKRAIQNIDKNEAELIGDVVVTQDTITIKTPRGFYDGNNRIAFSNNGLSLNDTHIMLNAVNGYYYFNEKRAYFYTDVNLFDKINNMNCAKLTYYHNTNHAVAVGGVEIKDTANIIYADSLIHYRKNRISLAFNNIILTNKNNTSFILGNYLENYADSGYTKVTDSPFLIQIDTAKNGKLDTLFLISKKLESIEDSNETIFIATDSVQIFRTGFASVNDISYFYKNKNKLITYKLNPDSSQPIMWYEENQATGDSIIVYIKNNRLDYTEILSNAFLLSKVENYDFRYNQISGDRIRLYFNDSTLTNTIINGKVLSIYYTFEDSTAKGLIKSSANNAKIFFENKKVQDVRLYEQAISEYHPEKIIKGKEKDFTLPTFKIFDNKPTRELFYNRLKNNSAN
jgi:hypothetical protein